MEVGQKVPALTLPAVSRTTLALFAGASGDHNPIHIDSDFAREAGVPDVFAHGMLSMAWLGRMLTDWQPQSRLRKFKTRFVAVTQLHDIVTCSGEVVELFEESSEKLARVAIVAKKQDGTETLVGEAVLTV